MKKVKLVILGLIVLSSIGFSNSMVVNAEVNGSNPTESTDVPSEIQSSVDELFDNQMSNNITVSDASFSKATIKEINNKYSFDDWGRIPLVSKYVLTDTPSSTQIVNLKNVTFESLGQYPVPSLGNFNYGVSVQAFYNGKVIKSKFIPVSDNVVTEPYTNPVNLVGTVTATHNVALPYAPLTDTENKASSRALAPNSDWYTDKFMINKANGDIYYRVSTSEWVNTLYIKPHANPNLKISNRIPVSEGQEIYTVGSDNVSGQTVYKSNGELWDYTLPKETQWKVTSIAFDQFGRAYCEVSNDAWVVGNKANQSN
ncbi:hypothetical protein [Companilactobacillus ginsenosidimutans]|uniref:Surface layer protein A domain-containing protein n=1 Tax=Companilactobacillus ginsenosidimutans TaxID=1007676 RepID=A0A0H4QFE1_9LACO|nr:hypothetical protein [Companilactobacillus ginsenosidimutans]AKP67124.1 hypothetical protein ABM34_05955 [Companilactobacillus ginsenosidimutans]